LNDALAPLPPDLKAHADYYRARGKEVREHAASIKSDAARSKFLQIADKYDRLAVAEEMASKPHDGGSRGPRVSAGSSPMILAFNQGRVGCGSRNESEEPPPS